MLQLCERFSQVLLGYIVNHWILDMWFLVSPSTSLFLFISNIFYSCARISSVDVKALIESLEDEGMDILENWYNFNRINVI